MKLTAIGLVAMMTIVVQLSPTMACDVKDLFPCLLPITNLPEPPTAACCQTLRDQGPCLCVFINNSWLWIGPTLTSPNGHKLFAACQVPFPSCGN
ncbi:unnamed protein product [Brassica oleracea var. botrytis]|uniref:Bifunctional inhibitor/plant lipid transfer protein/seed storage helical domain-containing protein n=2 Tax=Brassica TaxID=3705 RepID=A0ABQ7YP49_BRANA|nr:hypothetical protein HID58_076924 [Brassica napus]VDD38765.1 unnamed protein product [Brassica oleracea]